MDFKCAFEQALVGMTYVSPEGRYLRVNRKFAEMLGYSEEELLKLGFIDVTHPEHRMRDLMSLGEMRRGGFAEGLTLEKRYVRKDGQSLWVQVHICSVRETVDSAPCYFATVVDITHPKAVESRLKESQGLLSTIFNAAKVGIAVSSFDRRFAKVNPTFAAMLGYTEDELLEKQLLEVIHPDDRAKNVDYFDQFVAGRKNFYRADIRYLHKDGRTIWTRAAVSRLWHSHDEISHYQLTVCDDITELRDTEKRLGEQRAKLAATSKLSALGEMAGGIAHEINNPIAIIFASAQQMREHVGDDEVTRAKRLKLVERIERTSLRVADIVKALRNVSRDGELDAVRACCLRDIVGDALELCREKLKSGGIDWRLVVEPPELAIACRPTQLCQVILNLISNAYDAVTDVEDRWIELKAIDWGDRIRITVTDSGRGVPPEIRERILDPFFTTKAPGKGTGLGLSISRGIISQHGGTLALDPASARTSFVIELPKPAVSALERAA